MISAVNFNDDVDPTYSTVDEVVKRNKSTSPKMVRAEYDYSAQGREELTFREGDIIKVIREEDNTWWCGEFRGKTGMFPRDFVSVIK